MTGWRKIVAVAALTTGCVFPLDIEFDNDHDPDHDGIRGSGHVVSQVRAVAEFNAISASGEGRVIIERTGREALRIEAEDNLLPYLRTTVVGGKLILGPRPGVNLSPRRDIVYHLEVEALDRIESSGAVTFEADLGDQPELSVALSGVCTLEAHGSVDQLRVTLSGVTGFGGLGLESRSAHVMASGVSWANVWATEYLDASASGVSAIRYTGDPDLHAHTSGLSTIGRY